MHFLKDLTSGFSLLSIVLLPFTSAFLILILKKTKYAQEVISIFSSCTLFYSVFETYKLQLMNNNSELCIKLYEFIDPQIQIALKTETLSIIFGLLASFLWVITTIYSISYMKKNDTNNSKQPIFYACFAMSIGCTMGIAFSANLLTLFIFYELLTISTYPLITYHINTQSQISGRYYIGILLGTSMLLFLPAILIIYNVSGTLDFTTNGILPTNISSSLLMGLLLLLIYGIGKAALMPTHLWLPQAMVAPTPVSALLHAVAVVKSGVFTIIKILLYIIGLEKLNTLVQEHNNIIMYISGITIILASLTAIKQTNLKKLLAYSTISQLSYIVMAASLYTEYAIKVSIFQMISHAFAKITLFFAAGAIYTKTGKKYLYELHGIGISMPITMVAFSIGAIAMIGIPPAPTFWGKFFILSEALSQNNITVALVLVSSTVLNTIYFLPIIYNAFSTSYNFKYAEAPVPMLISIVTTAVCTLLLFFFPDMIFDIF
ncbi:NADH-Ubiquinone/plastoquinone (complex I), various chains family protein [Ehrlichia chaffeensis str. Liberty]|uniref:NADH-ubiquinone/plastoquinone oxidoreductase family protein n=1 Tax=Ehrlichia chaffeensis (strain ATCC CRL-10679 / Arkansas) TaxID=205920 RepID=Q2GHD5_EHRCR|nr:proton-conducting transporter membrane subunit [Ehrlichia chaffeensis]ABD44936.1 NADH-ubiquinone/plastoquinone oxidoreductase family protein [Ehrlichia chaffeensis str. Arkansas]AHX05838.1 NADH-Ubiquinone/plastoquinone (complex I), various chains family protein [Ehrlichia chaffeensis str. Jax]AHX06830.1 NADH-Ubiquinone/plastoquinone (complex I), various chains family protein [Ehrlichia chaffeensis str. Liberty]AHX07575.1 NADH-Ubiquinone/plastoquinone (complex I), various chains family protei